MNCTSLQLMLILFECHSLYHMDIAIIVIINIELYIAYTMYYLLLHVEIQLLYLCDIYNIMHATVELK